MKLYQKLIIPVLGLALSYFIGCTKSSEDYQSSRDSRSRSSTSLELIRESAGKIPGQPSIIYFSSLPPSTPLEIKVNEQEIPPGIPSGDFGDGLGTYAHLESLGSDGRPTGKRLFSLTALRPCTLRVECSQLPNGGSFTATFPYSGKPVVSTSAVKQMAKEAIYAERAPQDTSSTGGEGNGISSWFSGLSKGGDSPLQDWLDVVSKRDERRAK